MSEKYKKLLEPINIGKVKINNRIAMAPMTTLYAGHDGEVTEQCVQYYAARARGGTGLVTVEGAYVNETGLQIPDSINVSDDRFIPGLSRLADGIKDNGSVAVLQLIHSGIQAWVEQSVGPSEIGRIDGKPISTEKTPRALTPSEVEQYIEDFGNAAKRAQMAGFDIVQVHGTHGYLIMEFLSPISNKRNDNYGVDRDLFAIEIVKNIKKKCGMDFPVIFRLCADESLGDPIIKNKGGITLDDAKKTALRLEAAGVDAFDVTGGTDDVIHLYVPSAYMLDGNEGIFFDYAKEIKKEVHVPVISGGAVNSPDIAEKALEEGLADMVFVGRQLIADPDWVRKVSENRVEDIRPCVKCVDCGRRILYMCSMRCAINPLSGIEWKYLNESELPFARDKKKVMVIGGGPGGMEAAKTAAQRGHDVVLVESREKLGGTLLAAGVPTFKKKFADLVVWYENQLKKLNVKTMLNTKADMKLVNEISPDVVIMATGSEEAIPPIEGIENSVLADDVLLGKVPVGDEVIILGGGFVGAETALYLGKQNKKVTIFEALPAPDLGLGVLAFFRGGLAKKYGIEFNLGTPVIEVHDGQVVTIDKMGKKVYTKGDTIINAIGRKSVIDEEFTASIKESGIQVKVLGDAKAPRKVTEAVYEAFNAVMSI